MEDLPLPALSILILTIPGREMMFRRLVDRLLPQVTDAVEIVVDEAPPPAPIGRKRNNLLRRATGAYAAFIDDDDLVAEDYVPRVLKALHRKPDVVGLFGRITFDGRSPRLFEHSLKHTKWWEDDEVYYRCPNHLNPVRRELALRAGFPERNHGEDQDYSLRLRPLLKTEVMLERPPVYFYEYRTAK